MSIKHKSVLFLGSFLFLLALSLTPSLAQAAGTIQNGSFESGATSTPTAWQGADIWGVSSTTYAIVADAQDGLRGASVAVTNWISGDAKWLHTPAAVVAGEYYEFSFYYKSSTTTELDIRYNNSDTLSDTGGYHWVAELGSSAVWKQYKTKFFIPTGVTQIQLAAILDGNGTLVTDNYTLTLLPSPLFAQGFVTLSFDDAWKSIYDNAFPILTASGLKSTQYIYTEAVKGGYSDYMSPTNILTMFNAGHDIGAHTRNHIDLVNGPLVGAGWNYISTSTMLTGEIDGSRTDLLNMGIATTSLTNFAYPYGSYSEDVKTAVALAGFSGARSVDEGYNYKDADKFALKIQHVTASTTVPEIKGWIDTAKSAKYWLVLMFHKVVPNQATDCAGDNVECIGKDVLQETADYLTNPLTGTSVLTVKQGLEVINGASIPDTLKPLISNTPASTTVYTLTNASTTVTYTTPTATDNVAVTTFGCVPASGSLFAIGSTTVTCVASDAAGNTATSTFPVGVVYTPVVEVPVVIAGVEITPGTLPNGVVGTAYSQVLTASTTATGPFTWATTTGALPGGLTLSTTTGTISGTPIAAGTFDFSITVTNATSTVAGTSSTTQSFLLRVDAAPVVSGGGSSTPTPSGNGGGGGGGIISGLITSNPVGKVLGATTSSVAELMKQLRSLYKLLFGLQVKVAGGCPATLTTDLSLGKSSEEVRTLQKILNLSSLTTVAASGNGSKGKETTYFGPATKAAVVKFQNIFVEETLTPEGLTVANGVVGGAVRNTLNALCAASLSTTTSSN